jgi:hypothetical protein
MSFPPKKNTAYTFYVALTSQADTKLFQANPTLAAGDVKVSIDGGAFANITTLPTVTPAAGKQVKVDLSSSEMNGAKIGVLFSDAAGAEWCDLYREIVTMDAMTELAQAAPSATPTPEDALMAIYHALRDKVVIDKTSGEKRIFNDAGTCIFKKVITETSTTYTEAEAVSGP